MALTAKKPSQELIDLVGALGGTWHGNTAMCLCPAHADKTPSLSLRQGDRGILVTCFAGCDREDVLRELGRIKPSKHYAAPEISSPVGTGNAQRIWDQGVDPRGTLGEIYLRRRSLMPMPHGIRFHPRCPYLPKPQTRFIPALLIPVHEGRRLTAIQRIFLTPEGQYTAKVMLGTPRRGAWRGGEPGDTLAVAEGFETARAFTILNALPCWASLGARRLDQLQLPDNLSRLILAMDNDAEGGRAADKAEERYTRPGLLIERKPPPGGRKDWAKVLDERMAEPNAT